MNSEPNARERILAAVTEYHECTTRDLAERCKLNQSYARITANAMAVDGEIDVKEKSNGYVFVPLTDEVIE